MEESVIRRVMPNSVEAEQSVIGAMLMDREAITSATEILHPEDFYYHQYGVMFEAMAELHNEGKPVDLVTLQDRLKEKNVAPEVYSLDMVRELLNAVPTSANIKSYAQIVHDKAVMRRLIQTNEEIINDCYAGTQSVDDILQETEKKVFNLLKDSNAGEFVSIRQVALNVLARIEAAAKNKSAVTGVPSGFVDLDYMTSGFQPSDMILIAARPSMGKTAFVLNIAQHVAFKKGKSVAIFSLEMSKEQLVNRLFAQESRVNAQNLRNGSLTDEDWDKLIESAGVIGNSRLIIDDTPSISISELRSKCRKFKLEQGLGMIIIDYLQLMTGSKKNQDNRQQEVAEISRSLKGLARELNVPVIALSQLSRAVESRTDKRPMLSDLRESGSIEQDADVVMFIYRDEYYNKDTTDKGITEIIIAKQRNGPVGTVNLVWLAEFMKYTSAAMPGQTGN
ncbi:MAG: replicative DNA helicase [Lachnospiraceae bacterium]|nr:replicative DNA helicase [Lachnospiraceae bacterium]